MDYSTTDDIIKAALLTTIALNPDAFGLSHPAHAPAFVQAFAPNVKLEADGSLGGIGGSLASEIARARGDKNLQHYFAAAKPTKRVVDKAAFAKLKPEQKLAFANSLQEQN